MNIRNAAALQGELIHLLKSFDKINHVQLSSLSQFVQFEGNGKDTWDVPGLFNIISKASSEQIEQLVVLSTKSVNIDDESREEVQQLRNGLSHALVASHKQIDNFRPLFQLYQLQDLLNSFSFVQLLKFFEIFTAGTSQNQQLKLLQQLQQVFGQLQKDVLEDLHKEVSEAGMPEAEQQQLAQSLQLNPSLFHLYQPLRSLLHMELRELISFQELLPLLQPVQMLQILQLVQMDVTSVMEYKKVAEQMASTPSNNPIFDLLTPDELQTTNLVLRIVEGPPEKAVYKRNIKPNPSILLLGECQPNEELFVHTTVTRCDTFADMSQYLTGNRPVQICPGRVLTFKRLKIMVTSHQQAETMFCLRFELRRKTAAGDEEVLHSVSTSPICVLSHSTQMKPVPTVTPAVKEVIPGNGPPSGGTRVAIIGSDFADTPTMRVRFDNMEVIPEFKGPGTLVCFTPRHPPGLANVRVANLPGGWNDKSSSFTYTAYDSDGEATQAVYATDPVGSLDLDPALFFNNSNSGFQITNDLYNFGSGTFSLNNSGYSHIHYAAAYGNVQLLNVLLAKNRDLLHMRDQRGNSPLHWAAAYGHLMAVLCLLQYGAFAEFQNYFGDTPLHWACAEGHEQIVGCLLTRTSNPNLSNVDEITALHTAAALGRATIVGYLISRGAFPYFEDEVGETALHFAVREGQETAVQALLETCKSVSVHNARIGDHPNEDGEIALHLAASLGLTRIVQMLCHYGSSLEARDDQGFTPLHAAAAAGSVDVVRVILSMNKASPFVNAVDWEGKSALLLAAENSDRETAWLLINAGANVHLSDSYGNSPIHRLRGMHQQRPTNKPSPFCTQQTNNATHAQSNYRMIEDTVCSPTNAHQQEGSGFWGSWTRSEA